MTVPSRVDQIRREYFRLLAAGVPKADAARMAQGKPMTVAKGRPAPRHPEPATACPAPSEREETPVADTTEIPADWRDLPWPALKALAARFGSARNRAECEATIEAELRRRAT